MLDEKERKEQEEKERLKREKEARKYCKYEIYKFTYIKIKKNKNFYVIKLIRVSEKWF